MTVMPTTRRANPFTSVRVAGWSVVTVFVLVGAALFATVWTTRSSVLDATTAVSRGQAFAIEQAIRADTADFDGVPTAGDLEFLLKEHGAEGLRYIAIIDGRGQNLRILTSAGSPVGEGPADEMSIGRRPMEIRGRLRLEVRGIRRMRTGGRAPRFVIELEPVQANELSRAATRSLWIGGFAAASLLGVAIVLIRRERRRQAEDRAREHERRLANLGEMSAVLAHEIKNPLASLKGNAQLLMAMLPAGEKPRAKAERVVDEAVRLEKLTGDLLAFVRTGAIHRTPVDPGALVREAVESVGGDVTVDTTSAPARWLLDAARIREVIINLVDNAVAAGPPVRCTVRRVKRTLVIEVVDQGPGVPAEERDKIFEAFVTHKTNGTGLGLAVVRRVVELHGGTIVVADGPQAPQQTGALFRVEIPEA